MDITLADIEAFGKLPKVVDGIMVFESTDQVDDLDDYLSKLIKKSDDMMDDVLDIFEFSYADFTSYRSYFNNSNNLLNGSFQISELQSIMANERILGEVRKTFFNEDRLLTIGNNTYFQFSTDIILSFDKDDSFMLSEIGKIDDDYEFQRPNSILYAQSTASKVDLYSSRIQRGSKGAFALDFVNGPFYGSFVVPNNNIDCQPLTKTISVTADQLGSAGANTNPWQDFEDVRLEIRWGDNSVQIIDNYVFGQVIDHVYPTIETNYEAATLLSFSHPNAGPFPRVALFDGNENLFPEQNIDVGFGQTWGRDLVINPVLPSGFDNAPEDIAFTVNPNLACTDEATEEGMFTFSGGAWMSGNRALMSKIWVDQIIGNWIGRVGGYTWCWRISNGNTLSLERGNITVFVEGTFYGDGCTYDDYKSDSRQHNNDKKIEEKINKTSSKYHVNDDLHTYHRLIDGGSDFTFDHILQVCD
ncbi:MAG: hypothetical protein AB8H03_08355 [Saprospiraceae bacterium]